MAFAMNALVFFLSLLYRNGDFQNEALTTFYSYCSYLSFSPSSMIYDNSTLSSFFIDRACLEVIF